MKRRPKATPENYRQTYDYFDGITPSVWLSRLAYYALNKIYKPIPHSTRQNLREIRDFVGDGGTLGIVSNHTSHSDHGAIAGTAWQLRSAFWDVIGKVTVMAKNDMFNEPLKGWFLTHAGAVPVNRSKENKGLGQVVHDANERMFLTQTRRMSNGLHLVVFPEEYTNQGDRTLVQELKPGFARVIHAAEPKGEIGVVAFGHFHPDIKRTRHKPDVVVGDLFIPDRSSTTDLDTLVKNTTRQTKEHLQLAVNEAVWHAQLRNTG